MARTSARVLHLLFASAVAASASLAACTGATPSRGNAPDVERILVFYPVDGLVRGRGLAGTFPARVPNVFVRSHPGGTEVLQGLNADGGFEFALAAVSGDTIEIAAAFDDEGRERGEPIFLEVPPLPIELIREEFVCCGVEAGSPGTCQSSSQARDNAPCPTVAMGARTCQIDPDCGVLEGEYVLVDPDTFSVTAPNEDRVITVSGQVEPSALIQMENRALTALGQPSLVLRTAQITDEDGRFTFSRVRARGDDELVFRVQTLGGFRSAEVARLVPDASLAGVDIIGVFALDQEPLTNGARGNIAVVVSPYGIDRRGLCPNSATPSSEEWTRVCFTGGLTHAMVTLQEFTLDNHDLDARMPDAAATNLPLRGGLGDVRAGPLDVVVALDMSEAAANKDPVGVRIEVVARFIENVRQRDRVAVLVYGLAPGPDAPDGRRRLLQATNQDAGLRTADAKAELVAAVRGLANVTAAPEPDLFGAVEEAGLMLSSVQSERGRIIVLAGQEPRMPVDVRREAFATALEAIDGGPSGNGGYRVDIVGLDLTPGDPSHDPVAVNRMQDLTVFSQGRYLETVAGELNQTFTDLRAAVYGGIALLYNVAIDPSVGKSGNIELSLQVALKDGEERATATYQGPLRVLFSDR